jgi:hypothetical protein
MITASEAREETARVKLAKKIIEAKKEQEEFEQFLVIFDGWIKKATERGIRYSRVTYLPESVKELARQNGYTITTDDEDKQYYGQFTTIIEW